jgi:hypothetical protein
MFLAALRRRGPVRRAAALLAILGLLLQLAVAVAHLPAGTRTAAPLVMPWLAGAICIATGTASHADVGSGPVPRKAPACPICLVLSLGGLFLLPAVAAAVRLLAAASGEPPLPAPAPRAVRAVFGVLARPPP